MNCCDECELESHDLRYNKKWQNMICWTCYFDELIFNARKNVLYSDILDKNPQAYGLAMQAARKLFEKMPLEPPKSLF
jgi:hypothetical protein